MPRAMAEYDDHPNEHEPLTVWDEANAWVLRSQSRPLTEDERRQLADWRRGSPAHETELQNATRFWTLLDGLAGQVRRDHSTPSGPADRACFDHIHPQDARAAPQDRWARRFSMALAATLLIVVMAPLLWRTVDFWMSDYRTGTGERASVTLADGSVIHLNTRSAVSVELYDRRRNLTLKEGEALFEVAPDVERPFEVTADLGIIRAMGTVFDVYQHAGSTTVTVLEGACSCCMTARRIGCRPDTACATGQTGLPGGRSPRTFAKPSRGAAANSSSRTSRWSMSWKN